MSDFVRLILMLVLAGGVLTLLGGVAIWYGDEERRIRRGLRRVLEAEPEALLVAHGRGRGAGFSFKTGLFAVAWDAGSWCLVYRIDELVGAELSVDGAVVARAFRGEPRRALEQVVEVAKKVRLRLVFDDPAHPDFDLDLWLTGDEGRQAKASPAACVREANRWMARAEAILRRPLSPHGEPAPAPAIQAPPAPIAAAADIAPPWDEDDEDRDEDEDRAEADGDDLLDVEEDKDWRELPRRV